MRINKLILAAAALCAISAVDAAGQTTTNNTGLVLEIMARRPGVTAGDFDATQFQSYIFASASGACGLSTSNNPPANTPAAGWRVNGCVLGTTKGPAGDQLVVTVDWNRMWENGAATTDSRPLGSVKLTMSGGDTVVLDRIAQTSAGNCTTGDLRLVTSVVARSEALRPESMLAERFGRGFAGARGAGGAGGGGVATPANATTTGVPANARGGGRGAGTGTGATTTVGATGSANATTVGRGARGAGGATGGTGASTVSGTTSAGGGGRGSTTTTTMARGGGRGQGTGPGMADFRRADVFGPARYTSELWLVHKQPNGEEQVQQLSIQFGRSGADYSFPPVQVNTSKGVVMVDITGRLEMNPRPGEADTGARALYGRLVTRQVRIDPATGAATEAAAVPETSKIQLSISRRARSAASALDVSGGSSMAIDVPKPEEVLSFEFPALPKATEDLLAGHRFSIRLRVTPVK